MASTLRPGKLTEVARPPAGTLGRRRGESASRPTAVSVDRPRCLGDAARRRRCDTSLGRDFAGLRCSTSLAAALPPGPTYFILGGGVAVSSLPRIRTAMAAEQGHRCALPVSRVLWVGAPPGSTPPYVLYSADGFLARAGSRWVLCPRPAALFYGDFLLFSRCVAFVYSIALQLSRL